MAVEIVRRETIKPSSPTPPHLKIFKLSLLDQLAPSVYNSLVLFYPAKNINTDNDVITISQHIKKSLSEALTRFPPLAGRIANNTTTIDCTDDGAPYVEAKFNGLLSTFLDHRNEEVLKQFVPAKTDESPEATTGDPLLLVQATFFDYGGLAIGICVSHKFADAATLSIFLKSWVDGTGDPADRRAVFNPLFTTPPGDVGFPLPGAGSRVKMAVDYISKRYVFDKLKIAALKAKAASDGVKEPTRVEVVTALVWKCAIKATRLNPDHSNNSKLHNYAVLSQLVDIRKIVEPPFPDNYVGNLVGNFVAQVDYKEQELELHELVVKIRKATEEFSEKQAKRLGGDDTVEAIFQWSKEVKDLIERDDVNHFVCDNWCNFGFYEVDLGWGKPIWVSRPSSSQENIFFTLMDTRESGGVEVSLSLSKENMASFERDPELLVFASPII